MNEFMEFLLCYIDAVMLVYFFLKLTKQCIRVEKLLFYAVLYAYVQYLSDRYVSIGLLGSMKDTLLCVIFLLLYNRKLSFKMIICALFVDWLYILFIIINLTLLQFLHIQISDTIYGTNIRVFVAVLIKIDTIVFSNILIKQLRNIDLVQDKKFGISMFGLILLLNFGGSFVLSLSQLDDKIAYYTLIMCFASLLLLYLCLQYCDLVKKYTEQDKANLLIAFTGERVALLEKEREEIRIIQHDTKNQMLMVSVLLKNNRAEDALKLLDSWLQIQQKVSFTKLTRNTLINTILQQKRSQFPDIKFHFHIKAIPDLPIEDNDLISLLVNIIDNGCEELARIQEHDLYLNMIANNDEIIVEEKNACRKSQGLISEKIGKQHGYGLKIIKRIVEKYDGDIEIEKEDIFICKIMMIF